MDCRTFHRKLEDYLEGGLDFPARFGMERHAKQCYACEKDVTTALSLRQMAQNLRRVGAPDQFESSLLARIQTDKSHRRFWKLQSLWLYGLEGFSWRAASVAALATVIVVGTVTYIHFGARTDSSTMSQANTGRVTNPLFEKGAGASAGDTGSPSDARSGQVEPRSLPGAASVMGINGAGRFGQDGWATAFAEPTDSGFVEFLVPVSGDRQLILQLPRTIRMRYAQPSQAYFIRNVSH